MDKAEITWSDCKISSKSKVVVETVVTEGEIEVRSQEGKVGTLDSQRLGNTVRFQKGQVGVLKSQEIAKIVVRWRGWGMMTQLVIRGDRRWVNIFLLKLPVLQEGPKGFLAGAHFPHKNLYLLKGFHVSFLSLMRFLP